MVSKISWVTFAILQLVIKYLMKFESNYIFCKMNYFSNLDNSKLMIYKFVADLGTCIALSFKIFFLENWVLNSFD